jgi:phytoene dehydrogenase-like protein
MADVVVVGAGLAGLACARVLTERNVDTVVVESSHRVGGRVGTDEIDGFLVDRGFQVYLTAYPEGRRFLDLGALDLKPFHPGADVWLGDRFHRMGDPFRRPTDAWASLRSPVGSVAEKLKGVRLRSRARSASATDLLEGGADVATLDVLRSEGFSERMIERFFRPLFAGILLDRSLETSARVFRFVFKMLAQGDAAVPARGMQQIPEQLAAGLPEGVIRLGVRAEGIDPGSVATTGGRIETRATVIATDAPEAARLIGLEAPPSRAVAGIAFDAPEPPLRGPRLLLDGEGRGPVNNVAVMSEVAPAYAPSGRALVVVQTLDMAKNIEARVRERLQRWFGDAVAEWRHLSTHSFDHAHPSQNPPYTGRRPARLGDGQYVAGDHRVGASIDGALRSGRRAAEAVLEDLGA